MNRISLVTAAYNSGKTIADTLTSVDRQTSQPFEHIIVDGASTDDTMRIVTSWTGHRLSWNSERDSGIYDAMNRGIARSTGDIIGFLNSDDTLAHPRVFERIALAMTDSSVDACFADVVYVDECDRVQRTWHSGPATRSAIPRGWAPAHPSFYARRSVYDRFGRFNLDLRLAADHECMTRFLYRHQIKTVYIPDVWVRMKLGGATNSNFAGIIKQNREIIMGMRLNHIPISPLFPVWKACDRIRQRFGHPRHSIS